MNRATTLGLVAVIALVANVLLMLGPPAEARYETGGQRVYSYDIVNYSNWDEVRTGISSADSTTMTWAALGGATHGIDIQQSIRVDVFPRFTGATDTCTIRVAFFDSDGSGGYTFKRYSDELTATASLRGDVDGAGKYATEEGTLFFDTDGEAKAVAIVTSITGTVDIWAGTR